MSYVKSFILAVALLLPTAVLADFAPVKTKSEFIQTIVGKDLTMFGIRVRVTRDGDIVGRAYGRDVTGAWRWSDGYFCRDLFWGQTDLGPNCQAVMVRNSVVRFQSDRGTGRHADLTIQ